MSSNHGKAATLTLWVILFGGCNNPLGPGASLSPPTGEYVGYYYVVNGSGSSKPEQITGTLKTGSAPAVVSAAFTGVTDKTLSFSVNVTSANGTDVTVAFPGLTTATMTATWNQDAICFLSAATTDTSANGSIMQNRLCFNGTTGEQEVAIDFFAGASDEYVLVVDFKSGTTQPAAPPQTYAFDSVLMTASTQDFQSQVQYENTQLSHLSDLNAKMALIPGGLSATSIIGIVMNGLSWNGVLDAIGTFVPFLLPSRWIALDQANNQLTADQYAYTIMQENSANTAEGAAWALLEDESGLKTLQTYEAPISQIYQAVHDDVKIGLLPPGSDTQIETALDDLQTSEDMLQEAIADDLRAVAQVMGLMNPEGVTDVIAPAQLPALVMPVLPDPLVLEDEVWNMSLEHKQNVALINVAGDEYKNRFFYWMDPQGQGSNLGAQFPVSIAAGKEQIAEMYTEQAQLNQTENQEVATNVDSLTDQLTNYADAQKTLSDQQALIQLDMDELKEGIAVDGSQIEGALQQAMQLELTRNTAMYEFYIQLGNLNRLMLKGDYATIATPKPAPSPSPAPSATPKPADVDP